jgi:molecular chaperone IbpA
MVTQLAMDLFKDPIFIGFSKELERFSNIHREAINQSYPPYDVVRTGIDSYEISLAVAGFSKDKILINVENGLLIIEGLKENVVAPKDYLYKGIATRRFKRTFPLGEYMEVVRAEMADGILNIFVERNLPEEKKSKTIEIK